MSITQAIILAAGKGSRLGKHTEHNTKCMLEVNGEKLIDLSLKKLASVGITDLVLVVGYQKQNVIDYLGNHKSGIDIHYVHNDNYDTTNNIYSLYLAREFLSQKDTILLESDLIFDQTILQDLISDKRPSLAVVDKYESWMDGTVVTIDQDQKITSFIPKKFFNYSNVDSYYKTVNIYKFSKEFSQNTYIPFLEAYSLSMGHNEYYEQVLRVILQLEEQELEAFLIKDENWYEIDDIQDKNNAEFIFATTPELKLSLAQKRYGGFWRFPNLIDFCYLVNPYFPHPTFINECQTYLQSLLTQYPSGAETQKLLAGKLFDIDPQCISVANGAAETIKVLNKVFIGSFGIVTPTFDEYVNAIGSDRIVIKDCSADNFQYSAQDLIDFSNNVDNLILINPDNPSGHMLSKNDVLQVLEHLKNTNKNLILDESFIDFSDNGFNESLLNEETITAYPNLTIIKSISKSYGVPGARLGVTFSSNKQIIDKINKNLSIWNINSIGEFFLQVIGKYKKNYKDSCSLLIQERKRFLSELEKISFISTYPSEANYFLCEVLPPYSATVITKTLLFKNNLLIKDLSGKIKGEKNNYLRIAIRDEADNNALISALKDLKYD